MNLLPVFALLVAQRQGDSNSDAAKSALMAAVVKPPMAGLMIGMVMAANAPKPTPTLPLALPPPAVPAVAALTAKSDVASIANDGKQSATITVQAQDANQNLLANAPIDFSADMGGVISPVSSSTDSNGLCVSVLTCGTNTAARTINVTAASGAVSATPVPVQVVGSAAGSGGGGSGSGGGGSGTLGPDVGAAIAGISRDFDRIFERLHGIEHRLQATEDEVKRQLGQNLLAQVVPLGPATPREVPSFLWKNKEQARLIARRLGLPEPTFIARGESLGGVVIGQQPRPGSAWSEEDEEVCLELG
jgi:Bacterial Ig-like domain (group 1)